VNLRIGTAVQLVFSDPWDFPPVPGPLLGTVERYSTRSAGGSPEQVLLRLQDPADWRDQKVEYFVATGRSAPDFLEELGHGESVTCNLVAIPLERALGDAPLDTGWWRGGLSAIATVAALQQGH
jgi:hypothetical protein